MTVRRIPGLNLPLIADSGQCFRLRPLDGDSFELIAHGRLLVMHKSDCNIHTFDCDEAEFERLWRPYFDLDRDYEAILASIPEEDSFLSAAKAYAPGLRILRQAPFETLISFIISQRKNIPAIRRCVDLLSERFGEQIGPRAFAFPSPEALAAQPLEAIRACGLGYRSPYVWESARLVASGALPLDDWHGLNDSALMEKLCLFPGVGIKVAGCVMLFAFGRFDAFPRDVWINRVIDSAYKGHFPLENYKGHAGFIQQLMFYFGRSPAYRLMQEGGALLPD